VGGGQLANSAAALRWGFSELDHRMWECPGGGWKLWDPHISNLAAGLPAEDLGANARATGEVLAAEQSSSTIQVLAELKKQQREAPFKAPQVDTPVQYAVLAEIPATNPADAHSTKKFGLHQPRPSPDSPSSVTSFSTAATTSRPLACHVFDDLNGRDSVVGSAGLISRWQNGVPITTVFPPPSQVVRSTPLGMPCSELQ
jgi:hypothetical protein